MRIHTWRSSERDPARRGEAFGTFAAPHLHAALAEYLAMFTAFGISEPRYRAVAERSLDAAAAWTPALAVELEATARAASLAPWQLMALNARTEIMAMLQPVGPGECSTAVHVPSDGSRPRTMQTWDWHDTLSNDTVLRAFPGEDGTRVATFTEFGQLAKIGVNTRGLGLHFNILHHGSDGGGAVPDGADPDTDTRTDPGLPVHLVARAILDRASTVDEAVAIARELPVAASTVMTVVTRGTADSMPVAASIEISPAGLAVLRAVPGRTLAHTNHFLDEALAAGETSAYRSSTKERYDFLIANGELAAEPDDVSRVASFGTAVRAGSPGADGETVGASPVCLSPRAEDPEHLRWETKLSVTIDVDAASLGYQAASPAEVSRDGWRTFGA
ncbi:C45 family autoproteolytic acyltransferase/hydolase [Plantibacter sp. YIM 135347]|uniref:C45 family autoproteolytic acyltransferase/hydolase n=1 Tax=Plantibacter sp. YIM 135347 TaxID=3423919 RepID=UPI003D356493